MNGEAKLPAVVRSFFDEATNTVSYVLSDKGTGCCAIIDPVWDYDPNSGLTSTASVDQMVDYIRMLGLTAEVILETHAHADHLSASQYLQSQFDAPLAIGEHIVEVQAIFKEVFNFGADFPPDGSQFDRLLADGDELSVGNLTLRALHTPGHTPACMSYVGDGFAFVGDTLFMPDYGTARVDFPGGDAATLYRSICRLFELPDDTVLYLCHDYLPQGRCGYVWETTVGEERRSNIHVRDGISEAEFVAMRVARDRTLNMPALLLPSVQANIRAGQLPPPEDNGVSYLKIPINTV
ncbi:MAG: MBL fold metallo-hydrolase [Pseudomonadota bacterium]